MAQFRSALPIGDPSSAIADRLCAIGQYRSLSKGDALRAGDLDNLLVFIAEGYAKLVARTGPIVDRAASHESDSILAFHFPGDMISIVELPGGSVCLCALSDVEMIVFDTDQFLDTAANEPAIIRSVLAKSLHALQRSRSKVIQMGHKSARQRVASFVVSIAERVCGCTRGACSFNLPMSRGDIADSLGLTIETVSRQFTDLRLDGLLSTKGRSGITLHNIDALKQEAGP